MIRWILTICLVFVATPAIADDAAMRAAKRHFDRGEKLFALGKFDEALDEYQKAYDAKPLPGFLFNIGQCHRNLGDYDAAIFSFKKYLKSDPDANRDKIEALIDELEKKKDEAEAKRLKLEQKPVVEDPPPKVDGGKPFYKKWWFWTGVVVAGAAGGVGIYATSGSKGPPSSTFGNMVFEK